MKVEARRTYLAKISKQVPVNPLPPRLQSYTFANFQKTPYNKDALDAVQKFVRTFVKNTEGEGIMLYGSVGTGKTHLAAATINALKDDFRTAYAYVPSLLEALRNRTTDLETLLPVRFLVLDDIGSERETEWVNERLLILVEGRINNRLPTLFTTNYDPINLAKRLGQRLHSRITGHNVARLMKGPDRRQE